MGNEVSSNNVSYQPTGSSLVPKDPGPRPKEVPQIRSEISANSTQIGKTNIFTLMSQTKK